MILFSHTTDVYPLSTFLENFFVRTYFYLSESLLIYDRPWKSLLIYNHLWESLSIYDHPWESYLIYNSPWKCLPIYNHAKKSLTIYDHPRKSFESFLSERIFLDFLFVKIYFLSLCENKPAYECHHLKSFAIKAW